MPVNANGTLRPYNTTEITDFRLRTRGIRDGSHPSETYAPDGSGCTRKWLCDWEQRFDVIKHLVGEVLPYTDTGVPKITRLLPQAHPTMSQWICTKAEITGFRFEEDDASDGIGNKIPRYTDAEITAHYEQVPFRLVEDDDITTEIDRYVTKPGYPETPSQPFSEYLTFPGGVLKYVVSGGGEPHGRPIPFNVGMPLVGEKIQAVWRRIPETRADPGSTLFNRWVGDPLAGTMPWVGSVNSTTLFGRPPLTCLLESVEANRRPDPIGSTYSWDIRYTWIWKPQTHLRLYFFDTKAVPTITNGYYVIRRTATYADPTTFADGDSLFHIRDHTDGLFKVS